MKNQEEINQLKDERETIIKEEARLIPIIKTIKEDILKKKTIDDNDPLFWVLDKL